MNRILAIFLSLSLTANAAYVPEVVDASEAVESATAIGKIFDNGHSIYVNDYFESKAFHNDKIVYSKVNDGDTEISLSCYQPRIRPRQFGLFAASRSWCGKDLDGIN